jgi:hypothetical protein
MTGDVFAKLVEVWLEDWNPEGKLTPSTWALDLAQRCAR